MAKLFRIRDYVLLTAAVAGEVFQEIRFVGGVVPSLVEARYGFVPNNYKKKSYLTIVSRMLSTDLIERKINSKGEAYLELTSSGKEEFKRRFPIFTKKQNKWDGYFMQVIFDIPEKERNARLSLRTKLRELGFGMIQESVFVSPYHFEDDLEEFLINKGFKEYVFVMTVKGIQTGDRIELADKVWKIRELNSKYMEIVKKIKKGHDKFTRKDLWNEYFDLLEKDPFLPKELLPENWAREKVAALLNSYK